MAFFDIELCRIEELQEAKAEFEASGRARYHERDPISGALVLSPEKSEEPSKQDEPPSAGATVSAEDPKTWQMRSLSLVSSSHSQSHRDVY